MLYSDDIQKFTNYQLAQMLTDRESFNSVCKLLYDGNDNECYSDLVKEVSRRFAEEAMINEKYSSVYEEEIDWPW